jgi:LacI family transcriptional regulator/LacI family purine nucleotide synthesis repressor
MEDQYERESQYISILMEKQVDGIIMVGGRINLARPSKELTTEVAETAKRVPVLLINGQLPGTDLNRIYADERLGAELATQHLIDLGHRRIAFAGGYRFMSNSVQRIQGFRKTMERNGLAVCPEWTLVTGYSADSGKEAFETLHSMGELPTAVFCANDQIAIGMLKAARKAGLKVPEDLSLVGFDDIPYASYSIPELTTVSLRSYEVGRSALDLLHRMIGKEKVSKRTVVKPELIVRESTAPPRC